MCDDISIDHYVELIHDRDKEIISLRAKLSEAEKNAERYKWIREEMTASGWSMIHHDSSGMPKIGLNLDLSIDAAIAKQKGERSCNYGLVTN